jgi:hypothetical protein
MKKVLKVLSAAMLSAVVAVGASATAFAATGLNAAEERVLAELHTTVEMGGIQKALPDQYINQAEQWFVKEVDMTEAQADEVIAKINAVKAYLTSVGKAKFSTFTDAEIDEAVRLSNEASGVIGVKLTYNKVTRVVTAVGPNGEKAVDVKVDGKSDVVKTTGFGVPGVTTVAGVGVLIVTAAGIYLIRTSKKKETVDA